MQFYARALRSFPFALVRRASTVSIAASGWDDPTKHYRAVVVDLLRARKPARVLDAPCGAGWLREALDHPCSIDGLDLFVSEPPGYAQFRHSNLDRGLPDTGNRYEAIACCEGIEHFGNPELFFASARHKLVSGGMLIVTTPNTWYPSAKLQYLVRGFFPGFPCLAGKISPGSHMHIMPWSFPQLFTYLKLAGFSCIRLHAVPERKPRHALEWLIGWPSWLYCRIRQKKARTLEQREFWRQAGSIQSLFGRRLVVSAIA